MRLHWYPTPGGNFGDDLNLLLWPSLFPGFESYGRRTRLYGIGTVLGGRHDASSIKAVLGSGRGDSKVFHLDPNWDFRWVRGPKTAKLMGLSSDSALGDGAWLWKGLQQKPSRFGTVGFIPHHASWERYDWQRVARQAGLVGINPKQTPQEVVGQISQCSRILSESLHGAIFADALGVPWAPCVLSYRFNTFKWEDWCATIGRDFQPLVVEHPLAHQISASKSLTNRIARWADWGGEHRVNRLRPIATSTPLDEKRVADSLRRHAEDPCAFGCSSRELVARQRAGMLDQCALFAKDYGLRFRA